MRFRIQTKTKMCDWLVICHSLSALEIRSVKNFFNIWVCHWQPICLCHHMWDVMIAFHLRLNLKMSTSNVGVAIKYILLVIIN